MALILTVVATALSVVSNVVPASQASEVTGAWGRAYVNEGGALYEVAADSTGWVKQYTGVQVGAGSQISATRVGSERWGRVYVNEGGALYEVAAGSTGWVKQYTGVQVGAGSQISATHVGSEGWGRVYVNDGGALYEVAAGSTGWVKQYTGVQVGAGSQISATQVGSEGFGRVYVNEGGALYEVAAGSTGWAKQYTGVQVGGGSQISATHVGSEGWGRVYVNDGGALYEVAAGNTGWAKQYTGVQVGAGSQISATQVGSEGFGRVYVNEGGAAYEVAAGSTGWAKQYTGVQTVAGAPLAATYIPDESEGAGTALMNAPNFSEPSLKAALEAQGATNVTFRSGPDTVTSDAGTGIPTDAFSVTSNWAEWYSRRGRQMVGFYGTWAFRDGYFGYGGPEDVAGLAVAGFSPNCWTNVSSGTSFRSPASPDVVSRATRVTDTPQSASFSVLDTRRYATPAPGQQAPSALSAKTGLSWIVLRNENDNCTGRQYGSYFYEHNEGGSGTWTVGLDVKYMNVSYSTPSGVQVRKKASKVNYYDGRFANPI